jgi:hypothetical protein
VSYERDTGKVTSLDVHRDTVVACCRIQQRGHAVAITKRFIDHIDGAIADLTIEITRRLVPFDESSASYLGSPRSALALGHPGAPGDNPLGKIVIVARSAPA